MVSRGLGLHQGCCPKVVTSTGTGTGTAREPVQSWGGKTRGRESVSDGGGDQGCAMHRRVGWLLIKASPSLPQDTHDCRPPSSNSAMRIPAEKHCICQILDPPSFLTTNAFPWFCPALQIYRSLWPGSQLLGEASWQVQRELALGSLWPGLKSCLHLPLYSCAVLGKFLNLSEVFSSCVSWGLTSLYGDLRDGPQQALTHGSCDWRIHSRVDQT